MKYNCRWCEWTHEGEVKHGIIIEHDRTHPENHIDNIIPEEDTGIKVRCVTCGCEEDHTKVIYGSLGGQSND